MEDSRDSLDSVAVCDASRAAPALECRECPVICESVVSPWRCLKTRQKCTYAFNDGETTFFGCLYKVFSPELDIGALDNGRERGVTADPYGPLRVVRTPRPQCPVSVERAYHGHSVGEQCVNPMFLREVFRVVGGEKRVDGDSSESANGLVDH